MKIGLSIYSLYQAIHSGELTELQALDVIADFGADNVELVSFVTPMLEKKGLLEDIVAKCSERNLEISAYSIFSDILDKEGKEYDDEMEKVKAHIDITHKLGAKIMRSDLTSWGRPPEMNVVENFDRDLPKLVEICRHFAEYAKQYGITITVENHGTYINGGDRVRRLVTTVDRENFRCTLDIGNGLCVDEDPMVTVKKLLPFAATIHFKDFLIRKDGTACGASGPAKFEVAAWLTTNYGNYLKGTIVGDGDIDVVRIAQYIKQSGYNGAIAIEFEGMEDCKTASKTSLMNVKRYMELS